MKKLSAILLMLAFFSASAFAQGPPKPLNHDHHEKIESMRIAFITDKVEISSDQAKVFWPIYNEMQDEMKSVREDFKKLMKAWRKEDLKDSEAKKLLEDKFKIEQKKLDIEKKYHSKFLSVLSPVQVGKLYLAEEQFKRELISKMRDRDHDRNRERGRSR